MATISKFEDLEVWQMSRIFCQRIHAICMEKPLNSDFSIRDQIKRSSGSTMDNIAEGFERGGNREFIQFLYIAKGSVGESRSQLYRIEDFGYLSSEEAQNLRNSAESISNKLSALIKYLESTEKRGIKYKSRKQ